MALELTPVESQTIIFAKTFMANLLNYLLLSTGKVIVYKI